MHHWKTLIAIVTFSIAMLGAHPDRLNAGSDSDEPSRKEDARKTSEPIGLGEDHDQRNRHQNADRRDKLNNHRDSRDRKTAHDREKNDLERRQDEHATRTRQRHPNQDKDGSPADRRSVKHGQIEPVANTRAKPKSNSSRGKSAKNNQSTSSTGRDRSINDIGYDPADRF